jgi:hypothetical protein
MVFGCAGLNPQLPKHVIQVYGNASLGYYYVNLYIGTPPQEQSVIVDTGSGQLALPCSKCLSCGSAHIHRPFDLRQSSSSKIVTCVFPRLLRIQAMSYARDDANLRALMPAPLSSPTRREVLSPEYSSRMPSSFSRIPLESPSRPPLAALSRRLTSFILRQPTASSDWLPKGRRGFSTCFMKNIADSLERNSYFLCVWPRMEGNLRLGGSIVRSLKTYSQLKRASMGIVTCTR